MRSDRGFLWPALTIQAYLSADRSRLLEAAAVRTEDLYRYSSDVVGRYPDGLGGICWFNTNGEDGTVFLCVSWDALRRAGIALKRVPRSLDLWL